MDSKRALLRQTDEALVRSFEEWLRNPSDEANALDPIMRGKFEHLARLAREALDRRKLDDSGSLPPFPPVDDGAGRGRGPVGTCSGCRWCVFQKGDQDAGYLCTIDTPVIWKGENVWRFLRPEVDPETTPACSRKEQCDG